MVHSNYDWKWKWVEYVLITPAAHRIHHSTKPAHFNSNLGILSIWDRLFGTYIAPTPGEIIDFGVGQPDQKNYNTDHFIKENMACFWRWLGLRRAT
jgi:sterol desaturase/sphingolipid hydroxylase (fatty acid hydroxylase superfamily)